MLRSFVVGSALRRTQPSLLPRSSCRYKSITAAIERGRGSGPDRFAGPRAGSRPRPRYGDDEVDASRHGERDGGRTRPSRSKSSLGARRRRWEDDDEPPRRKELRRSGARPDESAVDRRIRDQDRERPAFDRERPAFGREKPAFDRGRPASDRERPAFGRERPAFDRREERPRDAAPGRRDAFQKDDRPRRTDRTERTESTFDRDERPRRTRDDFQKDDRPRRTERTFDRSDRNDDRRSPRNDRDSRTSQSDRSSRFDRMDRTDRSDRSDRPERSDRPGRSDRPDRPDHPDRPDRPDRPSIPSMSSRAPDSLPYTTAASEFIYGYSSVLAAIRASRRQFYKLYVNSRGLNRDILLARAKASNLRQITREVGDQYDRAFDKASSGRPHNGFILEASPLPVPPITELTECTKETATFNVVLGPQTKEEVLVNGTRTSYPVNAPSRYPLILYLDGILDEGNLGAIARSAYFLGADALLTPSRHSAPWSHIALKASAGAAESLPIFSVADPADFLGRASRNGWRCYAADAVPSSTSKFNETKSESVSDIVYTQSRSGKVLPNHNPLAEHPTLLMLGTEGAGLKTSLLNIAHFKVGIRFGRQRDEVGVDSLNVSVAAGVLCHDFLRSREVVERDAENVVF